MGVEQLAQQGPFGRAPQRLDVLQQLTSALARARTYEQVASVIIDQALPALHAEVGVVALASEDGLRLRNVGFKGVDAETEAEWGEYSVDAPVPVAEAAKTRQAIIVRTLEDRNARYPVLADIHGLEHGGPVTAFPLFVDESLAGVLAFCWGFPIQLDDGDLTFLRTLAEQCALAIERARLYETAAREIAERRASEQKLLEASRRKDEFLAMLAHELRNPLAPIRAAADLLELSGLKDERIGRVNRVLKRQVDHLKRIVDDLLDVARVAQGRMVLQRERVNLVDVVQQTCADHVDRFAAAGVAFEVMLPRETLWAAADATRLSQALGNLLNNARKFSPKGTSVFVLLQRDAAAPERAIIEVRDHGAGISSELLPNLFQPFIQADRSLARSSGGLGLGLSIARGVALLHGGDVAVQSDGEGAGAAFRLMLPLIEEAKPESVPPPSSVQPVGKRVLVVEDNRDAAEMMGLLIDTYGHQVKLAHHAEEALAVLDQWQAQVIFSDIGLPGVDGFEFAERVRARRSTSSPLLVAVSGYGGDSDRSRARSAGFDAYLTKPVDGRALAEILNRH